MFIFIAAYFAVFVTSIAGVAIFRRWSLKREIFDVPNERSSHVNPTPRGGGLIIFLVSLATLFLYQYFKGEGFYWAYFAGALIVGWISWRDDIKTISPFWRILCHGLAAALAVWSFGGFGKIPVPFYGAVEIGVWGDLLAFVWIVWLTNAYNFMDGIDGIAGTQAVTAGIGWALLGLIYGVENISFYGGVLAASALAFLIFNWQPAKIFMGDVGSAFLGYTFAVLPFFTLKRTNSPDFESNLIWFAAIIVWFFLFDSVYTLSKRLFRGEKVWRAHREHIYQRLVISGLEHRSVTKLYGLASAFLIFVLVVSLKYTLSFGRIIWLTVFVETVLLLLFQYKFVSSKKGAGSKLPE